jgi:hypothetical protein
MFMTQFADGVTTNRIIACIFGLNRREPRKRKGKLFVNFVGFCSNIFHGGASRHFACELVVDFGAAHQGEWAFKSPLVK